MNKLIYLILAINFASPNLYAASGNCSAHLTGLGPVRPGSPEFVLGWPYRINDVLTRNSPDGKFSLVYEGHFGYSTLVDSASGTKILTDLRIGRLEYGFSDDSQFLFFMEENYVLKKYNLLKLRFEDDVVIPLNHVFIRAVDGETLILRRGFSVFGPGTYGIFRQYRGLFSADFSVTYLKSSFADVSPDKIEFVAVHPQKKFAAIVTTSANYVDGWREQMGRFWSQFNFEVFELGRGEKLFSSETLPSYDWQRHTHASGVDAVYFKDNSLVISGYEKRTNHTIYDLDTNKLRLLSEKDAATHGLPVIDFEGNNLSVEVTAPSGERKSVKIPFEGFDEFGWNLQPNFQYSFLRNNEVLVLSHNQDFVAAIDILNGKIVDYEKVASLPGKERTPFYLRNLTTRRFNP